MPIASTPSRRVPVRRAVVARCAAGRAYLGRAYLGRVDLEALAALRTRQGEAALAAAAELADQDPVVAAPALRRRGVAPALAAAALTQARLRRHAVAKLGTDAASMFFTRAGLEQATRAPVAVRRAARLRANGVRSIADLGCGIGADTLAFARAGIKVYAVEADPVTAAVAAANVAVLGLTGWVEVHCGAAQDADLGGVDAVFCDPARRHAGTGRRVFDPAAFSPPWDFLADLVRRVPRTVLKLAPGIDHALVPAGAEAQWVSVGGDVVEAAFWCGPLAEVPRRATVLAPALDPSRSALDPGLAALDPELAALDPGLAALDPELAAVDRELTGSGLARAPVRGLRPVLYDPDGAVVRAHLVAEFASTVDGGLADPEIAYVYTEQARPTPFARCLTVDAVLPFSVKRLRAALRERGVGRVEIRKRGSAVDPETLRRDLRLAGNAAATVVLTRVAGAPTALLCSPVPDCLARAPDISEPDGSKQEPASPARRLDRPAQQPGGPAQQPECGGHTDTVRG